MINSIIFDWKQTLYDPASGSLVKHAKEVLEYLQSENIVTHLIGKGGQDMRDEVARLGVKDYFKDVVFVEASKELHHFMPYIHEAKPEKTIIVGDKLSSEIEVGNKLGATTIQVKRGKFAKDEPENNNQHPDIVVDSLSSLLPVLKQQNSN